MSDQPTHAGSTDPRIEAALRDYLERVDRGNPVDREEFLSLHAAIADQLRSFIEAEGKVRALVGTASPLERAYDSTKSFIGLGKDKHDKGGL